MKTSCISSSGTRMALTILAVGLFGACSGDGPADGAADTDTSSDTATEETDDSESVDTDNPCATCSAPACIAKISGKVLDDVGAPRTGLVQICIPQCTTAEIAADGSFSKEFAAGCKGFDFAAGDTLHLTFVSTDDQHTRYPASYKPAQSEISADGVNDFDFDVGTIVQYRVPAGETYTPAAGVSVDQQGVTMEIAAGQLGDLEGPVAALQLPLDQWTPPFDSIGLEALWYLSPYGREITGGGVTPRFTAPAGFENGDTATLWILADDYEGAVLECGGVAPEIGTLAACGTASVSGGALVPDSPISRFSWFGFTKD